LSTTYGPGAATRADADQATMRSNANLADRAASWDDRQAALEAEAAAHETYQQAYGHPAYAEHTAREGLTREHAVRGFAQIATEHQAQADAGGPEAGG
jgi:truncated hemoglobin YjbI